VLAATAAVVFSSGLAAHRLDECLQAARMAVEPGRVELQLDITPGVAVAGGIVSDIDRDHNALLSTQEQQAYVRRVLAAIELTVDGHSLDVKPDAFGFPEIDALRRGEGTIRLRFSAALPRQSAGAHQVFFRNKYRPDVSVYLANALVPESDAIAVTAQRHDFDQRDLTIDYTMRAGLPPLMPLWLSGVIAGAFIMTRQVSRVHCHRFVTIMTRRYRRSTV
jgi:hypothetical protein